MANNNSIFINVVTDFGADNTGTTDSSLALINAFNSISENGGTINQNSHKKNPALGDTAGIQSAANMQGGNIAI